MAKEYLRLPVVAQWRRSIRTIAGEIAVAILKDVFDDHVCHDFWAGELKRAHRHAMPLIQYVQSQPGLEGTYVELIKVAENCADKRKRGLY